MGIVDYIYYRLYRMYRKYNEPARFSSSLIFGMLGMISFFYISILFNKFLSNHYFSLKNFSQIHGIIWVLLIGIIISIGIFLDIHLLGHRSFLKNSRVVFGIKSYLIGSL